MASFQKIVLTIAVVILVIILVIIGYLLIKNPSGNNTWPPIIGQCPDYWVDFSGNGANCVNVQSLGDCSGNGNINCPNAINNTPSTGMNFSTSAFTDTQNGLCNKYNWASTNGITWDGVWPDFPNPCSSELSASNTTTQQTSS
jgi:hypothetical protein